MKFMYFVRALKIIIQLKTLFVLRDATKNCMDLPVVMGIGKWEHLIPYTNQCHGT